MARTVTFQDYIDAMYECYQAKAAEDWAAMYEQEPQYQPGVRPSSVCYPEASQKLNTYVLETIAESQSGGVG